MKQAFGEKAYILDDEEKRLKHIQIEKSHKKTKSDKIRHFGEFKHEGSIAELIGIYKHTYI